MPAEEKILIFSFQNLIKKLYQSKQYLKLINNCRFVIF